MASSRRGMNKIGSMTNKDLSSKGGISHSSVEGHTTTTPQDTLIEQNTKFYDMFANGQDWHSLFNMEYVFLVKTQALFDTDSVHIFEVISLQDDLKIKEFNIFKSIWKETLLFKQLSDPHFPEILEFGQLPNEVIYREIRETQGYSLAEYIA